MLLVGACSDTQRDPSKADSSQTMDLSQRTNLLLPTYSVAMDADYPPYTFRDAQGMATGFDVDVIQAIGEKQGFKVEITPVNWQILLKSLEKSRYDIAIGGIAHSDVKDPKYQRLYQLTQPYAFSQDAIATQPHVTTIHTFNDLKQHKVATLIDSGHGADLGSPDNKNTDKLLLKQSIFLAYKDLLSGKVEAVLGDKGVLSYYQVTKPNYPIVLHGEGDYFNNLYGMVFLVKQPNHKLLANLNQGIDELVKDGSYQVIYRKWFGKPPMLLPNQTPTDGIVVDDAK